MATVSGIVCFMPRKWGLFMDEYQRNFWKLAVAMGFESNFMVLTGDVDQGRDPRGSRTASADVAIYNQINLAGSDEDPLRLPFGMLPNWLFKSSTIQRCYMVESFRLGPTNVALTQAMFPGRHDKMKSVRGEVGVSNDSLVLLTLFDLIGSIIPGLRKLCSLLLFVIMSYNLLLWK